MNNTIKTDVLIAGCGCSGLYMAMNLPADKKILMITSLIVRAVIHFWHRAVCVC